uniref:PH domain-containing protein n=1 Tax=Electrophorus electricus TaxID=8005 RepID=A0A4W4GEZ5_ELEEL
MALVKSGCLHRQSTILRRWKKNWFELWSDGRLIFYDDQYRRNVEGEIHMKVDCINIRSATACRELTPPEGKGRHSLFQIVCRCGRVISLCAQSAADALAWTMALQDARVNTVVAARHFGFTQEVIASAPPSYWDLNPNRQVYYPDQYGGYVPHPSPYYHQGRYNTWLLISVHNQYLEYHSITEEHRRDDAADLGLGVLAGAATGLAIGSLFSVF